MDRYFKVYKKGLISKLEALEATKRLVNQLLEEEQAKHEVEKEKTKKDLKDFNIKKIKEYEEKNTHLTYKGIIKYNNNKIYKDIYYIKAPAKYDIDYIKDYIYNDLISYVRVNGDISTIRDISIEKYKRSC